MRNTLFLLYSLFLVSLLGGCLPFAPFADEPTPGPDKQSQGTFYGAATGAGSGAVIGAQIGSVGLTPGATVGASIGAVYGMVAGLGVDALEEDKIRRDLEEKYLRELAWTQEVLTEHYRRRLELHPNRDIFPADLFFEGDSVSLKKDAELLVSELAHLTKHRMPWSRIAIASYVTSADADSDYSKYVTSRRAREIAKHFVRSGFDPRRVVTQPVTMPEAILVDPYDSPHRYRQAIEIIPLDF